MPRHRLPPLRLFSVFDAVLRNGSLQGAAAEMNVSQPAISQAIKALEDHVGASLLDRKTRPPGLTEAGRVLHLAVAEGLGRIADAMDQIRAMQSQAPRSVTIACSVGTATYWLMPRLTAFYEEQPELSVNVMATPDGAPPFTAGVDLVLRYGRGHWTDGRVTRLFPESVVPVCHPRLHRRMLDQGLGLVELPLLHVESGNGNWMSWQDYLRAAGLAGPLPGGQRFANYVQATQAALDGFGVMLGWRSNTAGLIAGGQLVPLPFPTVTPEDAFYLVVPKRGKGTPAAELLADWLILHAGSG